MDEGFNEELRQEPPKRKIRMPAWIKNLNNNKRAEFAFELLSSLPSYKLAELHERIRHLLHRDFIADLPHELSTHILSFLDTPTLGRVACVSKKWKKVSDDSSLWRNLYFKNGGTVNTKLIEWYYTSFQVHNLCVDSQVKSISKGKHKPIDNSYMNSVKYLQPDYLSDTCLLESSKNQPQYPFSGFFLRYWVQDHEIHTTLTNQQHITRASSSSFQKLATDYTLSTYKCRKFDTRSGSRWRRQISGPELNTNTYPRYHEKRRKYNSGLAEINRHEFKTNSENYPSEKNIPPFLAMHQNEFGEPKINWKYLYYQRSCLEENWRTGNYSAHELPGHTEGIYCIQFDEDKIISGSRDNTIKIWKMESNRCLRTYKGHTASVLCLQYDDKVIISGSSDSTIIIWDLKTGDILSTLRGHTESVLNLRFDDRYIVSCSKDRTVRIWCRESGKCIRVLTGHRAAVNAVQFQDNYVVSASGDRTIRLWALDTGEFIRSFEGHERGIACIQFDGKIIVSGSSDKSIKIFDVQTGICLKTLEGHTDLVRTLQFDGNRIVSGSYDETLRIWDLESGKLLRTLELIHTSR
ncbi:hypothetical protein G9A89_019160 [Geosiphon pyriformis]|nr:hypothetical protein G9A89_019160 [Geosiphon pyriformis]